VRDEQCVGEAQGRCKYYSILLIVRWGEKEEKPEELLQ
jgi:hypothetical protein